MSINQRNKEKLIILTTSLLIDRVFNYSQALSTILEKNNVIIWTTSARTKEVYSHIKKLDVDFEEFPKLKPFKEFPYNYLRRLNEYAWDFYLHPPSRLSIQHHVKDKHQSWSIKILKIPAYIIAKARLIHILEYLLEKILITYPRSYEAAARFEDNPPDIILCTGPHRYEEPAIVGEAKKRKIPLLAMIQSWDNISTKNRMVFQYDGYLVWSEQMKQDLHHFYPATRNLPIYIVGAAQFDVFFKAEFTMTREDFCYEHNLRPELPI
ncbi:MAG: hypothetical protein H0U27_06020, partial [Nitrosopumilus sp.]|nr:hypothetical protein [Nitrosopumilus sp.]